VADELIELQKNIFLFKTSFYTRGSKFHAEVFLNEYGEWVALPRTGKGGRPKK
jgi:hypothetical protein